MTVGAIVWADSFGSQTTSQYATSGSITFGASSGRAGRSCVIVGSTGSLKWSDGGTHKLWIQSAAINPATHPIITMLTAGGVPELALDTNTGIVTINNGATTVGTVPAVPSNAWTFISIRGYFDASAGTVDVWYNETNKLSATGLAMPTAPSYMNWSTDNFGNCHISDMILQASATGSDTPVGDRAVIWLPPTGAGASSAWSVTGAASDWQATNESPPDGDTSYISSNTPGQKDTMAMTDLPASAASVQAVVAKWYLAKTDAGSRTVAPLWHISSTDYEGTPQTMGTTYAQEYQVYSVSPATSSAWGVSEVNGAQLGVELDA